MDEMPDKLPLWRVADDGTEHRERERAVVEEWMRRNDVPKLIAKLEDAIRDGRRESAINTFAKIDQLVTDVCLLDAEDREW